MNYPLYESEEHLQQMLATDINSIIDNEGNTILHRASKFGLLETVKEVLNQHPDVNKKNNHSIIPLHKAVLNNQLVIVQELIKHNSNINEPDDYGFTPLHYASRNGFLEIVKILLDHNSDRSLKNYRGHTALDIAKTDEVKQYLTNYQELPEIKEPM